MMAFYGLPPNSNYSYELVVERSRFIANLAQVDTVEEAKDFLQRQKKKYYDARHNCYAYIVDSNVKFSDDGEPQGTAGTMILNYLQRMHMNRICLVVTRYFGGVKLGTGGLSRAYTDAAKGVVVGADHWTYLDCIETKVTVDYSCYGAVCRELGSFCKIVDVEFAENVTLTTLCTDDLYDTITRTVSQITNGKGVCRLNERLVASYVPDGPGEF